MLLLACSNSLYFDFRNDDMKRNYLQIFNMHYKFIIRLYKMQVSTLQINSTL